MSDQAITIQQSESTQMLSVITEAAQNPDIDANKLEKLLGIHERICSRQAENEYNSAMAACQIAIPVIAKQAENKQTHSTYAKLDAINKAIRPVIADHGFALSFATDDSPLADHVRITCDVMHTAGHSKHHFVDIPRDDTGAKGAPTKTATHGVGSSISYGRRYLALLIFNIELTDEDNDGNGQPDAVVIDWTGKIEECSTTEELEKLRPQLTGLNLHGHALRTLRANFNAKMRSFNGTA